MTLETLKPFMHDWDVVQCSDHHFRQAIYSLGPFIADYPEQTSVSGIVYNWCVTLVSLITQHQNHLFTKLGVTLNPMISTIPMQVPEHENEQLLSLGMRTQNLYGSNMGLFRTFSCVITVFNVQTCSDIRMQPFMMRFPRADVHELLSPDLLHQAIKGTFKDHLVLWVEDYLKIIHGPSKAEAILDEIDRRCVAFQIHQNTF